MTRPALAVEMLFPFTASQEIVAHGPYVLAPAPPLIVRRGPEIHRVGLGVEPGPPKALKCARHVVGRCDENPSVAGLGLHELGRKSCVLGRVSRNGFNDDLREGYASPQQDR